MVVQELIKEYRRDFDKVDFVGDERYMVSTIDVAIEMAVEYDKEIFESHKPYEREFLDVGADEVIEYKKNNPNVKEVVIEYIPYTFYPISITDLRDLE